MLLQLYCSIFKTLAYLPEGYSKPSQYIKDDQAN